MNYEDVTTTVASRRFLDLPSGKEDDKDSSESVHDQDRIREEFHDGEACKASNRRHDSCKEAVNATQSYSLES